MRSVGKYGALDRVYSSTTPVFERYLTNARALPDSPQYVDRLTKVTDWPMYLNDQIGDCTVAGIFHSVQAMTSFSGRIDGGARFTNGLAQHVYSYVSGYVPGDASTDVGATLQSVAQYMVKFGAKDTKGNLHKLAAWAQVGDPTNLPLLKKILNTFGTVYCAFDIPQSAETQYAQNQVWQIVPGSPSVGGHCIPMQYSAVGVPGTNHRAETFITWGAEQPASMSFVSQRITEALVLVSYDWLETNGKTVDGLDLNSLLADMAYV